MGRKLSIVLACVLLVNITFITNAQTLIPADEGQLNTWFPTIVKPISAAKGTLEPNVVEAESGGVEIIDVRQDGSGKYKTISDAVKHVKVGNKKRVIITIGPGEYREKVKIERFQSYITFYGIDPVKRPTIVYAGTAKQYGTPDSATLIVEADYFVATNIHVANSAPMPPPGFVGGQAVAMRISGDKAAFYNCKFTGFQDTVCDDRGNHFFKDCYIEGTCDFVFGDGKSIYLNCELRVLPGYNEAMITAHARKNVEGQSGYSFVHCQVTGTGGKAVLGRAWMDAARVIFSYCKLSDAIKPDGWSDWGKTNVQKLVYFGEYQNSGPGAALDKRVKYSKKLTAEEAKPFISMEYIDAAKWLLPAPKV